MGAYRFRIPEGWSANPSLPGNAGLLIAPQPPNNRGVAIMVLHAIAPTGTLLQELEHLVKYSCRDLEILQWGQAAEYKTPQLAGVLTWVRVRERPAAGAPAEKLREFSHLYALLEDGAERVPLILTSGPMIAEEHRAAFEMVLATLAQNPEPGADP